MPFSQESPINLTDPIYADLGDKKLEIHWDGGIAGKVVQDTHGLKVEFSPDARQFIRLGGKTYHLTSFHFHHPSEHWVEGKQYPVELHVVHQNIDDASLAVVGIFIDRGDATCKCPEMVHSLRESLASSSDQPDAGGQIDTQPDAFLPENIEDYYRYEGSLTTPAFTENVSWAVLRMPFLMKPEDLDGLIMLFKQSARFPQPLNRRFILSTFREAPAKSVPPVASPKRKPTPKRSR